MNNFTHFNPAVRSFFFFFVREIYSDYRLPALVTRTSSIRRGSAWRDPSGYNSILNGIYLASNLIKLGDPWCGHVRSDKFFDYLYGPTTNPTSRIPYACIIIISGRNRPGRGLLSKCKQVRLPLSFSAPDTVHYTNSVIIVNTIRYCCRRYLITVTN